MKKQCQDVTTGGGGGLGMEQIFGLLPDHEIARLAAEGMVEPFVCEQVRKRNGIQVVSYGLCSFGYDMRVSDEWTVYAQPSTVYHKWPLDVKKGATIRERARPRRAPTFVLEPRGFVLACSVETFRMPSDVTGVVFGKSTWARLGLHVLVTPLEAGWAGQVTIEIVNLNSLPVRLYAGEGIAQVQFWRGMCPPAVTYAGRNGKYMGQQGVTLPMV